MSTIYLYGDESGTMPINDEDKVFVTCIIASKNPIPTFKDKTGHLYWVIGRIKEYQASIHYNLIKPFSGYGNAFQKKYGKMDLMARLNRLITRSNAHYLTRDGVAVRNYIWGKSMLQTIGQSILAKVMNDKVAQIKVLLDRKTMAQASRAHFLNQLSNIPQTINNTFSKYINLRPNTIQDWQSNLQFTGDNFDIKWSNEIPDSEEDGGLILAHYAASLFKRKLDRGEQESILKIFEDSKLPVSVRDITQDIVAPINRRTIEAWKRDTGLSEPKD